MNQSEKGILITCDRCGKQVGAWTGLGIETVIIAYESSNNKRHWLVWNGWKKSICPECIQKPCNRKSKYGT